jgi:hypothetical protein
MKDLIFYESRIPTLCCQGILEEVCVREWMRFNGSQDMKDFFLDVTCLREFFFVFYCLIWCNNYNGHSKIFEVCAPFSNTLDSHYAVIIHLYQLVMNFDGRKFRQYKPHKTTSSWE